MSQPNSGHSNAPQIRPQDIDNLPYFSAEQKQHYKNGLTSLWNTLENTPQGSAQHIDAGNKIRQASMKIMQQVSKNGGRPGSGAGPQRPNPNQPGGGQGGMPMQHQGSQQPTQQPPQPPQQAAQQLGVRTQQEIRNVKISFPAHVIQQGEGAMQNYRKAWMQRAAGILQKRDSAYAKGSGLQNTAQQKYGQQGQAVPREVTIEIARLKEEMSSANADWESLKRQNASVAQQEVQGMQRQHSAQGQSGGQQVNGTQEMQRPGTMQGVNNTQQADGVMNVDQNNSRSPLQPQGSFQQQQPQNHVAPSPAHQNIPQQPPSAHPQQTPQSATQPQPPQNFPPQNNIPQQQQSNQQPRPQMNPQQMQQQQQSMAQQQHQPAPTSGVPQSAGGSQQQQQQQQRPQPLTHQAAVSQAAESYSRQQAQAQQQQSHTQQPQLPNGGMALNGGAPPSATQQQSNTPSSAYPQLSQNTSQSGATNKFPIPKQLTLDPRTQMPVPGPPSRPTFSNAGMMSQPGVPRPAQFTLEGEGDRVLSKRKLDELVRQVTGSTASSSGDDSGENTLSPDVEESVLTLADDFVDNVITSACRLAKLRSSQTLDVRDVQLVLERNYGIRIPGYSLDEVRTVRKFQPAPGWQSKMQAVQAGKVMGGGNGGRDS